MLSFNVLTGVKIYCFYWRKWAQASQQALVVILWICSRLWQSQYEIKIIGILNYNIKNNGCSK